MGLGSLLENQLGHLPRFQKLHIFSISTSGVKIELIFRFMSSSFLDTCRFSKLPYCGMKRAKWPKFQKLYVYPLSYHGVEIKLIFALRAAVSEIRANIQNCSVWAWNLASGQSSISCTCNLFLHQRDEIELIFALRAAVSEMIRTNFQNCHIWAWSLPSGQSSISCTIPSFLPWGWN